jgi:hypothetical protein
LIVSARTGTLALMANFHHHLGFRSLVMARDVIHGATLDMALFRFNGRPYYGKKWAEVNDCFVVVLGVLVR